MFSDIFNFWPCLKDDKVMYEDSFLFQQLRERLISHEAAEDLLLIFAIAR